METSALARLRRRFPVLLLLGAPSLLMSPIALGQSLWRRDVMLYSYPLKDYLRQRLLRGELALWNPLSGLGRPALGLIQPGALYPLSALVLLPSPLGLDLFYAVHLFVLALGARRWVARIGASGEAAALAGLVIALSGYALSMLDENAVHFVGVAWIPWALAECVPTAATPGLGPLPGRAARAGLFLALAVAAGDPQAGLQGGLLCAGQALAAPDGRSLWRAVAVVAGAGALALLVLAPQIAAALEALPARGAALTVEQAADFALPAKRLVELQWPGAFGPLLEGGYAGALCGQSRTGVGGCWSSSIYLGLATPWLALAGLLAGRRIDRILGVMAALALTLALGQAAPLWEPVFRHLPGAGLFRYPEKYLFSAVLCLGALAARGLDALERAPRRAAAIGLLIVAGLTGGAAAARLAGPSLAVALIGPGGDAPGAIVGFLADSAAGALLTGALAWCPIALAATGRLSSPRMRALLLVVVAVDLVGAGAGLMAWTDSRVYRTRSPVIPDLERAAARHHEPYRLYRALVMAAPDLGVPGLASRLTLQPNTGMDSGIAQLDPYEVFHSTGETALHDALAGSPLRFLQVSATRFALLADAQVGARPPPGLRLIARYPDLGVSLFEVEGASPRVHLAARTRRPVDASQAAAWLAAPGFVPGVDAVIEGGEERVAGGSCVLEGYAPEAIDLQCDATAPAYAIVRDARLPGWLATVDAKDAPILTADLAMRAVPIPAGRSRVALRYRPRYLGAGFVVMALVLALALGLIVAAHRRSRAAAA